MTTHISSCPRVASTRRRLSPFWGRLATSVITALSATNALASCAFDFETSRYLQTQPITVALSAPLNGAAFSSPASVSLQVTLGNTTNETISKVDYLSGTTIVGTSTASPYSATWSGVTGGSYSITAKVYSRCISPTGPGSRVVTSAASNITVTAGSAPLTSVSVLSNSGLAPAALSLAASASDPGGSAITKVEFLANGSVIATKLSAPYTFVWLDAGPGAWTIQSRVTNALGGVATSAGVLANVTSAPAWPSESSLSQTRTSSFEYDPSTGLLVKEVVEPTNPALCVVTVTGYDDWGNKQTVTTRNCNGSAAANPGGTAEAAAPTGDPVFTTRSASSIYDARGQFVSTVTNALGHTETYQYDARFGAATLQTGPNGLSTSWSYDLWGRKTSETRPDGTYTTWAYSAPCSVPNLGYTINLNTCYFVDQRDWATGGAMIGSPTYTYFDQLGRKLYVTRGNFTGSDWIEAEQTYFDLLGRPKRSYRPYMRAQWGTAAATYTENTYDVLGRVTAVFDSASNTTVRTADYDGLRVSETRYPGGSQPAQTTVTIKNNAGQVERVVDAEGARVRFAYDANGNRRSTDSQGVLTSVVYDVRGRKVSMSDADMGNWSYAYNALGELVRQLDAKGQTTDLQYDALGRLRYRGEGTFKSYWEYDSSAYQSSRCGLTSTRTIGKLVRAYTLTDYDRTPCYDDKGRATADITYIGGEAFRVDTSFDVAGRTAAVSYPNAPGAPNGRLTMQYVYQPSTGYLQKVVNGSNGIAVWTANDTNAFGHVISETANTGITTTRQVDTRGRINRVTVPGVQDVTASWNDVDTVIQRTWVSAGTTYTENFSYDRLNRLQTASVVGGESITTSYDLQGNILSKTGVGSYSYVAGKHRLNNIVGTVNGVANPTFGYDNNGNLTSGAGFTVTPTSFDMPATINKVVAGTTVSDSFNYGTEHQRVKQVAGLVNSVGQASGGTLTTIYIGGGLYERETNSSTGLTEHKHYVSAAGRLIAVFIQRSNSTTQWNHFHQDHLGSTTAVTNDLGGLIEAMSFDAWGKRRNLNGSTLAGFAMAQNDRGYTGHEQLDNVSLVHMNGRIYDPMLARFMSADPFVQAPDYTQSYNRYMYVVGNPMTLTDPSGYNWISRRWKHDVWQNKNGRMLLAIAAAYFAGPWAMGEYAAAAGASAEAAAAAAGADASLVAAVGSSTAASVSTSLATQVAFGATGGFVGGLVSSGGDLKAGAQGALTGGMFGVVGSWDGAANYAGHAGVGCVSARLGGGSCARGALAQVISRGATSSADGYRLNDFSKGVVSTLTGGAVSAVTGGKFVDGAQSAAFGYLFNYLIHLDVVPTKSGPYSAPVLPYVDDTVHTQFTGFLLDLKDWGIDVKLTEAFRTNGMQAAVTGNAYGGARSGTGLHEAGFAIDINWNGLNQEQRAFVLERSKVWGLKWGGDFRTFDPVHFQVDPFKSLEERRAAIRKAQSEYMNGR